jgi:glycosyltransferase involved in cell wall biosynthesis
MKILIDLQGCQTASRYRGIGRYAIALATAIVRNRGAHEVVLLANGAFQEGLVDLRARFLPEIPIRNFVVFDFDIPVAECDTGNATRARLAELARERLIATISPDVVLLTSLFEGFVDDAVTSIGCYGSKPLTVVTLYDLIPYLNPDPNWPSHYKPYYDRKIASLMQADLLLSISGYARNEAIGAIPELEGRIVNMSSACDPMFSTSNGDDTRKSELERRYALVGPFIMSSGIIEPRKNFELLLRAFAGQTSNIRGPRQLVLVGGGEDRLVAELRNLASELGLADHQLIITGHVPDQDLLDLYRLCELFVFPSKHEGFGLPPLEAMSCGAVVIGSNATSVPEVIGREDALFDPKSEEQLRDLMSRALMDAEFRASLKADGLVQAKKFSWDQTAKIALEAITEALQVRADTAKSTNSPLSPERPKLAMVSPLPPEQTGIADYLADLLPELSKAYEITVISDQTVVSTGPGGEVFRAESLAWFEANATSFQRVVYQVGNSPFHAHMIDLLARYPGVVVLHDFFISSLKSWQEATGYRINAFRDSLINSHGYGALSYLESKGMQAAKIEWPCSFSAVSGALGVIVHSEYSRNLVVRYYGSAFADKVTVVKQHRAPADHSGRAEARSRLGIPDDAFLVCAFGFMDPTKLNHTLLEAWEASSLSGDPQCRLVFVGGKAELDYAQQIDATIQGIDGGTRIAITGFAPQEVFGDYLAAADVAIQLRTLSRGETSRTVLDCLAYGLPLVINAHGPMCEYPDDVLVKLPDEFSVDELVHAMDQLRHNAAFREDLTVHGDDYIREVHAPAITVQGYVDAIEHVADSVECQSITNAVRAFWQAVSPMSLTERTEIARKVTDLLVPPRRPCIYLDISATARSDLKTGIERVARALLRELLDAPPAGYQVVPVYLVLENGLWRVRTANNYLARQPGFSLVPTKEELVMPAPGDILMGLDLFGEGVCPAEDQGLYTYWRAAGAKVGFMVYDLLPISLPHFFPPWAAEGHEKWVQAVTTCSDFLVCISKHVRSEVSKWQERRGGSMAGQPRLLVSYLGADVQASFPTCGLPEDAEQVLEVLRSKPTFLMVGTIEPRKGHLQAIDTFEKLWKRGVDANLVIVGYEGWKSLPDSDRRTIPEIMDRIRNSPHLNQVMFWLPGISDEYLDKVYSASTCLIAASEDEGFGLPLIEAARHGIPVLARDIPVFRELGGDAFWYFPAENADGLAVMVVKFLDDKYADGHCKNMKVSWITWRESAAFLAKVILEIH